MMTTGSVVLRAEGLSLLEIRTSQPFQKKTLIQVDSRGVRSQHTSDPSEPWTYSSGAT